MVLIEGASLPSKSFPMGPLTEEVIDNYILEPMLQKEKKKRVHAKDELSIKWSELWQFLGVKVSEISIFFLYFSC